MSKKQIRQVVSDLTEKLGGREFLDRSGLTKKKCNHAHEPGLLGGAAGESDSCPFENFLPPDL